MSLLERDDGLGGDEHHATLASPLDASAELPGLRLGWQVWTVRDDRLVSVGETEFWPVRRARVARCATRNHVAPAPGCGCGLPVRDEAALPGLAVRWPGTALVIGCVAFWGGFDGRSTAGPGGRAKRAYPVLLIGNDRVTPDQRRVLGSTYGVPVYAGAADTVAMFADPLRRVVWQTLRLRLESSLGARGAGGTRRRLVEDLVAEVVTAWSAAEAWRAGRSPAVGAPRVPGQRRSPETHEAPAPAVVPDVAGLVVAWRTWQLAGTRLTSVTCPDAWPGLQPMVGACAVGGYHSVPAASCSCGVYAARDIAYAGRYHGSGSGASVMGCVGLWGRLVEAEFGWRAQKAYPLVLLASPGVPTMARQALERTYGVTVVPWHTDGHPWSTPSTGRAAEVLRAALERSHGRIDGPVSAAIAGMNGAPRAVSSSPPRRPARVPPVVPAPPPPPAAPPVRGRPASMGPVTAGNWAPMILYGVVVATIIALLLVKLLQ
ncbi:hypothetical protein [Actinomycetospora termitidis]|uniref:Uncharacterized protein n=1 Tax=Actinomycetospora termitidis TaxID=3053470 RepID=A0ABT7ME20_9PSEU|nr:hypothetical protein [Actinomycetospora sp. Odt1-22]MDL5158911.1 hypothetical protein [Actinomycetospora sp. Odt1-22]